MAGAGGDHDGRLPFAPPPPSLPPPPARKPALLLASASSALPLTSGPATTAPGPLAAAPMAGEGADRDGRLTLVLREPGQGLGRHQGPEARPLFGNLFGGRRGHEGASPAPAPAEATGAAAGAAAPAKPLDQLLDAGREGSPLGQGHITWRRPPPAAGLAAAGGPPAPAAGGAAAAQMHPRGGGIAMDGAAPLPRSPSPPPAPAATAGTPVATPHGGGCARTLGWPMDVDGIGAREARARSEGLDCWDDVARAVKLEDGGERGKSERVCDWDDTARVVQRRGVHWDKISSRWRARLYHKGTNVYLGRFTSEAAAMRTYDRVALAARPGVETNFPSSDYSEEELAHLRSLPLDDVISMARQHLLAGSPAEVASEGLPVLVSKRRGVSWNNQRSQWKARWYHKGTDEYLGFFTSEAAAMRTYDRVALVIKPGAGTNFPSSDYSEEKLAHLRSLPLEDVISMARQHLLAGSPAGSASEGALVLQPALPPAESLTAADTIASMHTSSEPATGTAPVPASAAPPQPPQQPAAEARVVQRRGVSWDKRDSKWRARWYHKGTNVHLGYFTSEAAAMRTYDRVALVIKPGAGTNFPSSDYTEEELAHLRSLPLDDVISKAKQRLLAGSPPGAASEGAPVLHQLALAPAESPTAAAATDAATAARSPPSSPPGAAVVTAPSPHAYPGPAAAAAPPDPARAVALLGRQLLRSFYIDGRTTPQQFTGHVSEIRYRLRGDGSPHATWVVTYEEDGDVEELECDEVMEALVPEGGQPRGGAQTPEASTGEPAPAPPPSAPGVQADPADPAHAACSSSPASLGDSHSAPHPAAAAAAAGSRARGKRGRPAAPACPGGDPASFLGRRVRRRFYPDGVDTLHWFLGRVSATYVGSDSTAVWEVTYDDGDVEEILWDDLQAGMAEAARLSGRGEEARG